MNGPTNVREALVAEAIGDLLTSLEDTRIVVGDLRAGAQALKAAGDLVDTGAQGLKDQVQALTRAAQVEVMRRVAVCTKQLMRETHAAQVQAMQTSASEILHRELASAMQRVIQDRRRAVCLDLLRSWHLIVVALVVAGALGLAGGWWLFAPS